MKAIVSMREKAESFSRAGTLLDAALARIPTFEHVREMVLSPILPLSFSLADDYRKFFPQHASLTSGDPNELIHVAPASDENNTGELLSPTCCYPLFYFLRGTKFESQQMFTVKGWCFRKEHYYEPWVRERAFVMREYIIVSSLGPVEQWIDNTIAEVNLLCRRAGLEMSVIKATDPFFDPNSIKGKIQKQQELKREFVVDGVAIGSVNLHLASFCAKTAISINNAVGVSACFGMGYNRLWNVLVERLGIGEAMDRLRTIAED